MKRFQIIYLLVSTTLLFSCRDKTLQLISKKWDCIQVENLEPLDKKISSREDSLVAAKMTHALKNLHWNFKNTMEYECSTGATITAKGSYSFTGDKKSIICTSATGNVAVYDIVQLTETELVLKNWMENVNIVLHFKVSYSND
jgi:hypothetical protein